MNNTHKKRYVKKKCKEMEVLFSGRSHRHLSPNEIAWKNDFF